MITALWIVGYLAAGLIAARIVHLTGFADDDGNPDGLMLIAVMLMWPFFAAVFAALGLAVGVVALVTMPTRRQRAQQRIDEADRIQAEIRADARRLGLPLLEDDR